MSYDDQDDRKLPLFDQPPRRTVPAITPEDIEALGNVSRAKVAQALADGKWHHTQDLVKECNHRFSTGVDELRKRGWVIELRPCGRSFEYRYVGRREMAKTPRTFKEAYFSSAHWKGKRAERITFDGGSCCQCKVARDLHVHHWRYDLFKERIQDLMTLCSECHGAIHNMPGVRIVFPEFVEPWMLERLGL